MAWYLHSLDVSITDPIVKMSLVRFNGNIYFTAGKREGRITTSSFHLLTTNNIKAIPDNNIFSKNLHYGIQLFDDKIRRILALKSTKRLKRICGSYFDINMSCWNVRPALSAEISHNNTWRWELLKCGIENSQITVNTFYLSKRRPKCHQMRRDSKVYLIEMLRHFNALTSCNLLHK